MNQYSKKNLIVITLFFLSIQLLNAQTIWTRYPRNLIMTKTLNNYEGTFIGSPSIIDEGDTLKMLYAVNASAQGRISYAFSIDAGITWTKYNNATPIFDVGSIGSWDSYFLDTPDWIKDKAGYKMYYFGDTDNSSVDASIGLATSSNGINWTRSGPAPVLKKGNPGDWDGLFVGDPTVVYDGVGYYMWYSGIDTTWQVKIGFATSADGITWAKHPGNPVLNGGALFSWEGYGVGVPTVIKRNGQFEMWYNGVSYFDVLDNGLVDTIRIGFATSTNGINWTKSKLNPIFNTYDAGYNLTEYRGPWAPDVVYRPTDNKYYMWYETGYGFGLSTSPDNILSTATTHPFPISFSIYPNPASESITIKHPDSGNKGRIRIFNSMGILLNEVDLTQQAQASQINIAGLPKGLYFIRITNLPEQVQKFIKH